MEENNKIKTRKQLRIKEYDYSNEGYYYITICTKNKIKILSKIQKGSVKTEPYIELETIGKIVEQNLLKIEEYFETIKIHDYIIMPNHIHLVIEKRKKYIKNNVGFGLDQTDNKINISNVIGLFKSGVSRKIGYSIWQKSFYEHIIRNEKEYIKIKEYIKNNPIKWENDEYNL